MATLEERVVRLETLLTNLVKKLDASNGVSETQKETPNDPVPPTTVGLPGSEVHGDLHLLHFLRASPGVTKWLLPALFSFDTRCGFAATFPARIAGGHVCLTVDIRQLTTVARACSGGTERVTISGCRDMIKNLMSHHDGPALGKVDTAMQKTARAWLPFASSGGPGAREWAFVPIELLARLYRIVSKTLDIAVMPEDLMKSRDLVCEWTTSRGFSDRADVPTQRKVLLGVEVCSVALTKVLDPLRAVVKALHGAAALPKDQKAPFHVGPFFRPLHHHPVRTHEEISVNVHRPMQESKAVPTPRKRQFASSSFQGGLQKVAKKNTAMQLLKLPRLDEMWKRTDALTETSSTTHTPNAQLESML